MSLDTMDTVQIEPLDRRGRVTASHAFNGIDFVEIADSTQATLNVHFLNEVPLQGSAVAPTITGGETIPTVAVKPVGAGSWSHDDGHLVLTLRVTAPGDFSIYTLTIEDPALDPFFDHVPFSFKAQCLSDLDCRTAAPPCPPLAADIPPIDYLAKDFLSFRQALIDFSALRYPQFQERSEADFGMMFLEALSAVADDLSYTQDRIAAEAALVTATQRRSAIRHARLVDYEPQPVLAARVMLQFDVASDTTAIKPGLMVNAPGPDGTPVVFETGTGLVNRAADPPSWPASALWNAAATHPIRAYWFDDSARCLAAGATKMYVLGRGYGFEAGQTLLIETAAETTADPPIRQLVELTEQAEECDLLLTRAVAPTMDGPPFFTCEVSPPAAIAPTAVTRLVWRDADKLTAARDLTRTVVVGNIVPATQGQTFTDEAFVITASATLDLTTPQSVVRTGPRPTLAGGTPGEPMRLQLYSLANAPLTWLPAATADAGPVPEIVLTEQSSAGGTSPWTCVSDILDAKEFDRAYTLDAARLRAIQRNSDGSLQVDYDGDGGDTIRFGGNGFGVDPADGTRFAVTYRVGAGAAGNVAADAITRFDPSRAPGITAVTNPLPSSGGADPETLESIRRFAPQKFRASQVRAVIPSDYEAAAQSLPWVQKAGTAFRWTGSWLTAFTTPEPFGSEAITIAQRTEAIDLLNRYRMAGYESYVPDVRYVSIDLIIDVCAAPAAFQSDVKSAITAALSPAGPAGFFRVNNFTFGQPLERSALEAAIQRVPGVAGILCVRLRVRGRTAGWVEMPDALPVGAGQVIRCDNDPSAADSGSFSVNVAGGK
jgi:hypothetical protein